MSDVIAPNRYSPGEELANALTHALGIVLSAIGLIVLIVVAGFLRVGGMATVACAVYGASLIALYSASTLYHSARSPAAQKLLRTFDHLAIFLLIAGTYTPFVLIALHGVWRWVLFGVIWALAALGVTFELTALRRFRGAMVALYIAMGWVGLAAIKPLADALPTAGLWLLFGGGVSYTFGVLFYQWRSLRYHHAVWHLFVLAGSVLHYFSVLAYVLPLA